MIPPGVVFVREKGVLKLLSEPLKAEALRLKVRLST
jgi:hypothetical protein